MKHEFPPGLEDKFRAPAIESTLEAALDSCPNTSMILDYEVECAEYPCMVWLSVQEDAAFPPLPSCEAWSRVYSFDGVTDVGNGQVHLLVIPVFAPDTAEDDFMADLARRTQERQATMLERFRP